MSNEVANFYDSMAAQYHTLFVDWDASVHRQGSELHTFLGGLGVGKSAQILDCACGIGTQAIALATQGYQVTGTDLSAGEIERAKENVQRFELDHMPTFAVADLLQTPENPQQFDVVLAYDNVIAHFPDEATLTKALSTMQAQCKAGGLITISVRPYDELRQNPPKYSGITIRDSEQGRNLVFQTWDWSDDLSYYDMEMFYMERSGEAWRTTSHKSRLRAWTKNEILSVFEQVGLQAVTWYLPDQSGFYQPVVTARKPV